MCLKQLHFWSNFSVTCWIWTLGLAFGISVPLTTNALHSNQWVSLYNYGIHVHKVSHWGIWSWNGLVSVPLSLTSQGHDGFPSNSFWTVYRQKNNGHFGSHGQPCDRTQQQMLADQPFQLFIEQHSTQHTTPFKMCSGDSGSQSGQGTSRFMLATIC